MALAALANLAAATGAGYKEVASQDVAGNWFVVLEKFLTGDPDGGSGHFWRAYGTGSSQANAETAAVNALNQNRVMRYGADTGTVSNGKRNTNAHTRDVT